MIYTANFLTSSCKLQEFLKKKKTQSLSLKSSHHKLLSNVTQAYALLDYPLMSFRKLPQEWCVCVWSTMSPQAPTTSPKNALTSSKPGGGC
jgi:hypothetical protein